MPKENSNSTNKVSWTLLARDGLLIAMSTFAAYVFKFIYDYSYGRYFGLPAELVSYSLSSLFPTLLAGGLAAVFVLYLIGTVFHHKGKMNFIQIAYQNLAILTILTTLAWPLSSGRPYYWVFLAPSLYILLRHFLIPIITHRKLKGYINKSNAHFKKAYEFADTPTDIIWNFALYRQSAILILVIGVLFLTALSGHKAAETSSSFYVLKSNEKQVAVRFIDNKVVLVGIDENKKLTGEVTVKDLTDDNTSLIRTSIGKLSW